ncbi:hypothetical protein ACFFJN_02490 [Erwinia mallotivora]
MRKSAENLTPASEQQQKTDVDVLLIGGGIMSATLGLMNPH